jgi:Asp-tRNA(Asn)/Glu-tRNA(Gln) amidotransferase A subunit family amidase
VLYKANLAELASGMDYDSEMGGSCRNPFDLSLTCGSSSSGSGASVASGFAVIGRHMISLFSLKDLHYSYLRVFFYLALGTDTDGSILSPSSNCGLFGLRTTASNPSIDAIIPAFERQDSVGPMTKYLKDLVLSYSIMLNNLSLYEEYSKPIARGNEKLKLGFVNNFFEPFNISSSSSTISYVLDPAVKALLVDSIGKFKQLGVALIELSFEKSKIEEIFQVSGPLFFYRMSCATACTKNSFNNYFNDSTRFAVDAPYTNFDQLASSPLLSVRWSRAFNRSQTINPIENCMNKCQEYDSLKAQFINIVEQLFVQDIDGLIMPTYSVLPEPLNKTNKPNVNPSITVITSIFNIATLANLPALNIPIVYMKNTSHMSDGLPLGVIVISKSDRLMNIFRIAKLYEENFELAKLPHNAPLLDKCVSF